MSKSASIDIVMSTKVVECIDFIKNLLRFGWTFSDDGLVSYLPIGDDDNFDWKREKMEPSKLLSLLKKKEDKREMIGVVLTYKDTGVGGEFLFRMDKNISFSLSKNRKEIKDCNVTDVNWYITRILPAFEGLDSIVESVSWEEHA